MKSKSEKEKLLKTLQDAAGFETLSNAEMEAVDGGLLDSKCVHNHVTQCGCQITENKPETMA